MNYLLLVSVIMTYVVSSAYGQLFGGPLPGIGPHMARDNSEYIATDGRIPIKFSNPLQMDKATTFIITYPDGARRLEWSCDSDQRDVYCPKGALNLTDIVSNQTRSVDLEWRGPGMIGPTAGFTFSIEVDGVVQKEHSGWLRLIEEPTIDSVEVDYDTHNITVVFSGIDADEYVRNPAMRKRLLRIHIEAPSKQILQCDEHGFFPVNALTSAKDQNVVSNLAPSGSSTEPEIGVGVITCKAQRPVDGEVASQLYRDITKFHGKATLYTRYTELATNLDVTVTNLPKVITTTEKIEIRPHPSGPNSQLELIIPASIASVVIFLVAIIVLCCVYKKRKEKDGLAYIKKGSSNYNGGSTGSSDSGFGADDQLALIKTNFPDTWSEIERYIIPTKLIHLSQSDPSLGHGHFGMVKSALYDEPTTQVSIPVAVKTLHDAMKDKGKPLEDLANEGLAMLSVTFEKPHPNLLRCYGFVYLPETGEVGLVTEYCDNKDLEKYLHKVVHEEKSFHAKSAQIWLDLASQIARGMHHITSFPGEVLLHRDLDLRNCFLKRNPNYISGMEVKIADFGLSKFIKYDYYRAETNRPVPVRITAPEIFKENLFTKYGDIWSWGFVLWQLMTGKRPFHEIQHPDMVRQAIVSGFLPEKGDIPDDIFDLCMSCWNTIPHERPEWPELVKRTSGLLDKLRSQEQPPPSGLRQPSIALSYITEANFAKDSENLSREQAKPAFHVRQTAAAGSRPDRMGSGDSGVDTTMTSLTSSMAPHYKNSEASLSGAFFGGKIPTVSTASGSVFHSNDDDSHSSGFYTATPGCRSVGAGNVFENVPEEYDCIDDTKPDERSYSKVDVMAKKVPKQPGMVSLDDIVIAHAPQSSLNSSSLDYSNPAYVGTSSDSEGYSSPPHEPALSTTFSSADSSYEPTGSFRLKTSAFNQAEQQDFSPRNQQTPIHL